MLPFVFTHSSKTCVIHYKFIAVESKFSPPKNNSFYLRETVTFWGGFRKLIYHRSSTSLNNKTNCLELVFYCSPLHSLDSTKTKTPMQGTGVVK